MADVRYIAFANR